MNQTMYDSTTPGAIPANAAIVAPYVDGAYAWTAADLARFPVARVVEITVFGRPATLVGDVESGCIWPEAEGAKWANNEVRAGRRPTVYSSRSSWPIIAGMLNDASKVDWWAADPTGVEHLVPGSVATQWAWPGRGSPGHYDVSVTNGAWPGSVPPLPPETESMDDLTFLTWLYRFTLYRAPDKDGFALWAGELQKGASRAEVFALFQNGPEGVACLNAQRKSLGLSPVTAP